MPPRFWRAPFASYEGKLVSCRHLHSKGAVMRRVLFWGTVIAGLSAAYMMYRRGEPLGTIAAKTAINPLGSLVSELKVKAG
jgi:hypothetical protein